MKYQARIEKMASGNLSLLITEEVTYESFPEQAKEFVEWAGGRVLMKMDGSVSRIWIVMIRWRPFFLSFDDVPWGMTLDSMVSLCNTVVRDLHRRMQSAAT